MNLIDVYVQEVTRRLPEKSRKDIALELQSTIADMLPDDYKEEDVICVLEKLGDPVQLAYQYRDRQPYVIGPAYYDQYVSTLKMVLPIAVTVILLIFFIEQIVGFTNEADMSSVIATIIAEGIASAIEIIIQAIFWVTLVFFILERTNVSPHEMRKRGKQWQPVDLYNIPVISKKSVISKGEVYTSLIWTAIWATVYFNAMHYIGVYERNEQGVLQQITPIFNEDVLLSFWRIVVIFIGMEIALAILKWVMGRWTVKLAIVNTVYQVLYSALFIVIILHPDLFAGSLQEYIELTFPQLTMSYDVLLNKFIRITIVVVIIAAVVSIIDGFRKSSIWSKN